MFCCAIIALVFEYEILLSTWTCYNKNKILTTKCNGMGNLKEIKDVKDHSFLLICRLFEHFLLLTYHQINKSVKTTYCWLSVQSAGLYVTISLLRDSRQFPGDNTARSALIVVFHVRFLVLNYSYSSSDILALTSSSLTMHWQLNWPSVGLSFQPLLVLFVLKSQNTRIITG